jgi:hypothetical protein
MMTNADMLLERIKSLPPERVAEVEDFVAFLAERERARSPARAAMKPREPAFAAIWKNPDDSAYDCI